MVATSILEINISNLSNVRIDVPHTFAVAEHFLIHHEHIRRRKKVVQQSLKLCVQVLSDLYILHNAHRGQHISKKTENATRECTTALKLNITAVLRRMHHDLLVSRRTEHTQNYFTEISASCLSIYQEYSCEKSCPLSVRIYKYYSTSFRSSKILYCFNKIGFESANL